MDQHTKLISRLKELRKMHHYNQEFVASYLNISRQAYSHYETGHNTPPIEALTKLAQLYQIPAEEFLNLYFPNQSSNNYPPSDFSYLDDFLNFTSDPHNLRYQGLSKNEKLLIYFYHQLSFSDQEDLLEFLKIRNKRTKKQN